MVIAGPGYMGTMVHIWHMNGLIWWMFLVFNKLTVLGRFSIAFAEQQQQMVGMVLVQCLVTDEISRRTWQKY